LYLGFWKPDKEPFKGLTIVTKCHIGEERLYKAKKCHVLFEWPLIWMVPTYKFSDFPLCKNQLSKVIFSNSGITTPFLLG